MRHALRYLRGIKSSVKRLVPRPAPERADLNQTALLHQRVAGQPDGADEAGAAVAFFDRALRTAGVLSVEEVGPALAAYDTRKPAWRASLLDQSARWCGSGLPVYAAQTGPLNGGLDWSALRPDSHGDRLYLLRPHRFGFLPRLAMAALLGADTLPALSATLEAWIAQVERTGGADDAYFSNLVIIYRLLAIGWAVPFLTAAAKAGDETAAAICLSLFRILAADVKFLRPRLGDSVPNNHLLADRFAAWFLAACYPALCPQQDCAALERAWLDELDRQFRPDGTNFEQSVHYHELGCEMALVYLVVSLRSGARPAEPAFTLIRQLLRFQAAITDAEGCGFALGDTTEDPLLPLDEGAGWGGGAWRVLYRDLFDPAFPATADTARGAERAYWVLVALQGVSKPLQTGSAPPPVGPCTAFPDNGYIVLSDDDRSQRVLFRSGPRPGVEISPGHAMSDLLSVYWNVAGQPVLEPAGTYSYTAAAAPDGGGPARPRNYLRSPAAHNGLVLRGHDPLGTPTDTFRDRDNGTRVTTRWRALDGALAWAEGDLDETGPLQGCRRGVLHLAGRGLVVYDRLPDLPERAELACRWQFAPEVRLNSLGGRRFEADLPGMSAYFCAAPGLAAMTPVLGQADPPGGWVSRRYGQLAAAPQLICPVEPSARHLAFAFGLAEVGEEPPALEILESGRESLVLDLHRGERRSIAWLGGHRDGPGENSLQSLPFDLDFRGEVLWLDLHGAICREIRALGLRRLRSSALGLDLGERSEAPGWHLVSSSVGPAGLCGRWWRAGQ